MVIMPCWAILFQNHTDYIDFIQVYMTDAYTGNHTGSLEQSNNGIQYDYSLSYLIYCNLLIHTHTKSDGRRNVNDIAACRGDPV